MAIMQVDIPERKQNPFMSLLSTGSQAANIYSMFGSTPAASTAGGAVSSTPLGLGVKPMTSVTEGMSPTLGGGAASGSEAGMTFGTMGAGMAAPMAVGIGGMALGAKADIEYSQHGSSSPWAKYSSKGRGPTTAATSADIGRKFYADTGTLSRRMEGITGGVDSMRNKLVEGKLALNDLKIDQASKELMAKKIDLGLSKLKLKF